MLDLLGNPDDGPGIDAEAWLTVRADDLFLFVTEQRASAVLNTAAEEVESQFPQDDPGFAAAFASAIHARLAPFGPALGTRLYAYIWAGGLDSVPRLLATSDQDESFEISWEDLDEPRLRPLERTYRPYVDVPLDVREGLGI